MRMSRVALVFCVVVSLVWSAVSVSPALACSGGTSYSPKELLTLSSKETGVDTVIQGRIIETDFYHQNSIVQVQRYFKGGPGPQYVLLEQVHPVDFAGLQVGQRGGGDCIEEGERFEVGETIFAFAHRYGYGSYGILHTPSINRYRFSVSQNVVEFEIKGRLHKFTVQSFGEYLIQVSGIRPTQPAKDRTSYPLKSPLLIATSKGSQYIVPVDWTKPVKLSTESHYGFTHPDHAFYKYLPAGKPGCFALDCGVASPDYVTSAGLDKESKLWLDARTPEFFEYPDRAEALLYSPTSEGLAIWHDGKLGFYTILYHQYGGWPHEYNEERLPFSANIPLNQTSAISPVKLAQFATWSADGRMLAYSDAKGLWLWEVYSDFMPRLLLPTPKDGSVPYSRYFSPRGRYLAITEGNKQSTLELSTETRLPDGLVSPDERLLLAFDTRVPFADVQLCYLTPVFCPKKESQDVSLTRQIAWQTDTTYIEVVCKTEDLATCEVGGSGGRYTNSPIISSRGYAFDYESFGNLLVVLKDKTTITINGEDRVLRPDLDGDIVSVRWLQSLFIKP